MIGLQLVHVNNRSIKKGREILAENNRKPWMYSSATGNGFTYFEKKSNQIISHPTEKSDVMSAIAVCRLRF